jgi:hypothetical protein
MKKTPCTNVLLFQLSTAAIAPAFRKAPALLVKNTPRFCGASFNFNKQSPSGSMLFIPSAFYKVFNPLTAAWLI